MRFAIGEAFPADDQLARWMTVCAMAWNDILVANSLLLPRLEEKVGSGQGENFYLVRSAAGHLFEVATFLRKSDRIPTIRTFVGSLDEEARAAYAALLAIGDGGRGEFQKQLKHARNKSFHYQELFLGDHEEREPLKMAMAGHAEDERDKGIRKGEIRDVPPALTGFRATFAFDIAVEMLLPGDTEKEYRPFIAAASDHIAKFALFVKAAMNSYTTTTPPEIWDVEAVEAEASFLQVLAGLQELVGQEVFGQLLLNGRFFGLGFHAHLERVETLPAGDAIKAQFSNGMALDIGPNEQTASATDDGLELRVGPELVVLLKAEAQDGEGSNRT